MVFVEAGLQAGLTQADLKVRLYISTKSREPAEPWDRELHRRRNGPQDDRGDGEWRELAFLRAVPRKGNLTDRCLVDVIDGTQDRALAGRRVETAAGLRHGRRPPRVRVIGP